MKTKTEQLLNFINPWEEEAEKYLDTEWEKFS